MARGQRKYLTSAERGRFLASAGGLSIADRLFCLTLAWITTGPFGRGHGDLSLCYRIGIFRNADSTFRSDAIVTPSWLGPSGTISFAKFEKVGSS